MAGPLLANNISTVLAASLGPSDVLVVVANAAGMPTPGVGEYFYLTIEDASNAVEVVRCTSRAGTTLTVQRAQDGTTAQSFTAGDVVELRPNAQLFRDVDWRSGRGQADGIAGLDAGSKVPVAQLPVGTASGIAGLDAGSKVPVAQLPVGTASGIAGLDAGSKVPVAQLPDRALDRVFTAANEAAQLALTAQEGDVAVRSDTSATYMHNGGTAGTMADWTLLPSTGAVQSVNTKTGAVVLNAADVGAVATSAVGAASGVASLGTDTRVPVAQAPLTARVEVTTSGNVDASYHGKFADSVAAGAITLTVLDTVPDGFFAGIVQGGTGQVTIAAGGSLTLRQRRGAKTAGQRAVIGVTRLGNDLYVYGDTAT